MAKDYIETRRNVVLRRARHLARSGRCQDHREVWNQLQAFPDHALIQHWFDDERFQAQLDQLCELARGKGADYGPRVRRA
jgi:uncharacterized protein (DUF1330 family)